MHQAVLEPAGGKLSLTCHLPCPPAGHGDWAPIMGVGYYRPISQWSKVVLCANL
jgi:hypothetical protein